MRSKIDIDEIFLLGNFYEISIGSMVDKSIYRSSVTQDWQTEYGYINNYNGLCIEVRLDKDFRIIGYSIDPNWQFNSLVVYIRGKQRDVFKISLNSLIEYLNGNNIKWRFDSVMTDTIFIILEESKVLLSYCFENGFKHGLTKISI